MAQSKRLWGLTFGRVADRVTDMPGLHLRDVPPSTTLLVRTSNSLYRVVVTDWPEVYVQGGAFFPDPTVASIGGASLRGHGLKVGWIGAGLSMEIHSGGRHIITSRVLAITTEQPSGLPDE